MPTNADVATWHNDICRTGWQSYENVLTAATGQTGSVNQNSFGLLWQWSFNGVAAQPLALTNVHAVGCNPCDLVFIATSDDMLFAYNAASNSPTPVWSADLGHAAGGTAVSCTGPGAGLPICDPPPDSGTVGVTGTPVIDRASNFLYAVGVVAKNDGVEYDLFAVNILNGQIDPPMAINGSVTGLAPNNPPITNCSTTWPNTGTAAFDPNNSRQRGALLLLNGNMVYVPIAPSGQPQATGEYKNGWLFGYQHTPGTFTQVAAFNTTPFGTGGGIWQSGAGPSAEVRGGNTYIYATTGNGTFDLPPAALPSGNDIGDSELKFSVNSGGGLSFADYYTPSNLIAYAPPWKMVTGLCATDADFGSGGVLIFPEAFYTDSHNATPNLSVTSDKQSNLYVLNRDSMGHFNAAGGNLVELNQVRYTGQYAPQGQGFWSTPAYWKYVSGLTPHYVLYSSVTNNTAGNPPLPAPFPIDMYDMARSGSSGPIPSVTTSSQTVFCAFSPTPLVSSNGTSGASGIVWAAERPNSFNQFGPTYTCDGTKVPSVALHAFNAITMAELYTSRGLITGLSNAQSFSSPTVFQGRVYLGSSAKVNVFGLCTTGPMGRCLQ